MKEIPEKYIKAGKKVYNTKPLYAENEILQIIGKSNTVSNQAQSSIFSRFNPAKWLSVLGLSCMAIIGYLLMFNQSDTDISSNTADIVSDEGPKCRKTVVEDSGANTNLQNNIAEIKHENIEQEAPAIALNINTDNDTSNSVQKKKPSNYSTVHIIGGTSTFIRVLNLDSIGLEQIGIKQENGAWSTTIERTIHHLSPEMNEKLEGLNYNIDKAGFYQNRMFMGDEINTKTLPYNGWNIEQRSRSLPVIINKITVYNNRVFGDLIYASNFIVSNKLRQLYNEAREFANSIYIENYINKLIHDNDNPADSLILIPGDSFKNLQKLALVVLKGPEKNKVIPYYLLWYYPTVELDMAMPDRYKGQFVHMDFVEEEKTGVVEKEHALSLEDFKENISGIMEINLTPEQLPKLGIQNNNEELTIKVDEIRDMKKIPAAMLREYMDSGADLNFDKARISRNHIFNYSDGMSMTVLGYYLPDDFSDINNYSKVQPIAIQFYISKLVRAKDSIINSSKAFMFFPGSPLLSESLNQGKDKDKYIVVDNIIEKFFVPVNITFRDSSGIDADTVKITRLKLWYLANDEFIECLPREYSEKLKKELGLINEIENGNMEADEACEALKGDPSYLDICRFSSGSIHDVKIYPNPVTEKHVHLHFDLECSCRVSISLHSADGKLIKIFRELFMESGEHGQTLDLDVEPGYYMISIKNEQGDNVVRKIIVQ